VAGITSQRAWPRFPRHKVHWPIHIAERPPHPLIETQTENLSSDGLYFHCAERFDVGEELECVLLAPSFDPDNSGRVLALKCQIRVMQVEILELEARFGTECQIERYSVLSELQTGKGPMSGPPGT
jgi:hypothetical protein